MAFLKISIVLISTVLYAQTCNADISSKQWPYTNIMQSKSDDNSNCICYPKGQLPSIHNILDSNNGGQERIVVYFYKNIGSNEIKMYTPGSDKQLLIPDLPYDSGDALISVTTETIDTLFYSNPNRIKIYDNLFEKLKPGETVYWPIGLHQASVEDVYPQINDNYKPKDQNNVPNTYNVDMVPNGFTNYDSKQPKIVPEVVPLNWPPSNEIIPKYNYQVPSLEINPNDYKKQTTFSFKSLDYLSQTGVDDNSLSLKQFVTFDEWFKDQLKIFQDYHLPAEIQSIDFYVLRVLVEEILYNNDIRIGYDNILRYPNGEALKSADLELRPLFIGQTLDYKLLQANPPEKIILPKFLPYIEGILVTLAYPPRVLGVVPMGKTYLAQYYQVQGANNQNVSFLDELVKTNTQYVQYPPNYGQQWNIQKSYSSVTKPSISSSYYYQKPEISYPQLESNNGLNWILNTNQYPSGSVYESSGPSSISQTPYITNMASPSNAEFPPLGSPRRKLSDVKIEHQIEHPKLKNKKQVLKDNKEEKEDSVLKSITEPQKNLNASASRRNYEMPSIKTVVKELIDLLTESRTAENDNILSSNSTEELDIINESEDINDGERPDYRIIGGNAATGSGTPLSNKGRSARIERSS